MTTTTFAPLCELPHEEQVPHLANCIRQQIAAELNLPPADIPLEARFESLHEEWENLFAVYELLQPAIEEQLGRDFFSWEMIRFPEGLDTLDTIHALATSLVARSNIPVPKHSFRDPFEGGTFAWKVPAPIVDNLSPNPPMVFLLASPRSGSTLLRVMLEGHPDLFAPPELNLLMFESLGDLKEQSEALGYPWMRSGLPATLMGLEGLSEEAAYERLEDLETQDTSIQQAYKLLQDQLDGRLLVDKTPIYSIHKAWLDRAETIFDGAKYLCLVRHPYAMIESFVRMRFNDGLVGNHLGVWDENPWLCAEKVWAAIYHNILDFFAGVDPERQHIVRYEDLVAKPQEIQSGICEFLEIPFDVKILNPYEGERMLELGGGDPNMRDRDQIDPTLATAWRDKQPPHQLSHFTQELAARFGYELE